MTRLNDILDIFNLSFCKLKYHAKKSANFASNEKFQI